MGLGSRLGPLCASCRPGRDAQEAVPGFVSREEGGSLGSQGVPHPSPFDGVTEEPHDVVPFCSGGLEALGPVEEDALREEEGGPVAADECWGQGEGIPLSRPWLGDDSL